MNWSKNSSIELSRICVVLFMILLAALDIGCYWAVQWFVEIRLMYWQYGVLMMVTIYLCSAGEACNNSSINCAPPVPSR